MNSDPLAPNEFRLKRSARQRIFSSDKRYRHASIQTQPAEDPVAQARYQIQRNEQWIYL